jgi:hypothetical protein
MPKPTRKLWNTRACICCGEQALFGAKDLAAGETPVIMSITPVLYRRSATKSRQLKNAQSIRICERCLVLALAPPSPAFSPQGEKLLRSFQWSLTRCYSALTGEKCA